MQSESLPDWICSQGSEMAARPPKSNRRPVHFSWFGALARGQAARLRYRQITNSRAQKNAQKMMIINDLERDTYSLKADWDCPEEAACQPRTCPECYRDLSLLSWPCGVLMGGGRARPVRPVHAATRPRPTEGRLRLHPRSLARLSPRSSSRCLIVLAVVHYCLLGDDT